MTVTLSVTEGTLTMTAGGSGAGVAGCGTSSVTITGTVAQINALLDINATCIVSYAMRPIRRRRTVTLTLRQRQRQHRHRRHLVSVDTATITITPVNDAPMATITPATYTATENMTRQPEEQRPLDRRCRRRHLGTMTVTLAVTEGTLNITAGSSGAVVTTRHASVTITGTVAQINALLNTDEHLGSSSIPRPTTAVGHADARDQRQRQHRRRHPPAQDTATINITASTTRR